MSSTERILLVLIAAALTLSAVELMRREVVIARRTGTSLLRVDASAAGALFTSFAALGCWVSIALNRHPAEGLWGIVAWLAVALFLLVSDSRVK